jgi:trigger factor
VKKEISQISNTRSLVSFCFSPEEVISEKNIVIGELCASATLPGFRKGKVPKNIVAARFAPNIDARVKSALLNKAFEDAQKSANELNLLTVVDYSTEDLADGFLCKLAFDLRPNVELPDYKSIALTAFSEEVSGAEVEGELEQMKKQYSSYNSVDREARAGDYVKVNYEGTLEDGLPISAAAPQHKIYGKQTSTWEEAGNADVAGVQAVIQGVIGHRVGDKCEGEEVFPEGFFISQLAGKKATYSFEILDVRERVDPELNETFFKRYGVDSFEDLKAQIGTHLTKRKRSDGLLKQRDEIVHFLANSAKFELPESIIAKEVQGLVQMFINSQARNGIPVKLFEGRIGEISQTLLPTAEIRAKAALVLDKIAEVEKFETSNKDLEAMLLQDVALQRKDLGQYVRELRSDGNKLLDLRKRTLRGKVLDFLLETNSKGIAANKGVETAPAETSEAREVQADFKEAVVSENVGLLPAGADGEENVKSGPKRTRRSRKSKASPEEAAAETSEAEEVQADSEKAVVSGNVGLLPAGADGEENVESGPKKTRRSRKSKASPEEAAAEAGKPKENSPKKTRKPRKSKASPGENAENKKTPRRRKTKSE